jgi:hypothetical protein
VIGFRKTNVITLNTLWLIPPQVLTYSSTVTKRRSSNHEESFIKAAFVNAQTLEALAEGDSWSGKYVAAGAQLHNMKYKQRVQLYTHTRLQCLSNQRYFVLIFFQTNSMVN